MAKRRQQITVGDVFAVPIPTAEGVVGVGQVISEEPDCLNSVLCAFFVDLLEDEAKVGSYLPSAGRLLSVQLTTRDLLDSGKWKVCGRSSPLDVSPLFPIDALRANEFVGAKVRGSKSMWELISAYNGKSAWDDFHDPMYLDNLLLPGLRRPRGAILKQAPTN